MSKVNLTQCPVCRGTAFSDYLTCKDYSVSKEEFQLQQCGNCGFIFTQDAPSEDTIGPYYESEDYISHSDTRQGLVNRLYHTARTFMLRSKQRLVTQVVGKAPRKLLDMGSGTGYFLNHMKLVGWDVRGVEPSPAGRDFAGKEFGLNVIAPEVFFASEQPPVSVVTMWHVLEHVHDLDKYLEQFHALLEDKGALVIAVPNPTSLDARHYGATWAAYDVPRHLWHFTPDAMRKLVTRHGFHFEATHRMPLDAFYVSLLSEKYKGNGAAAIAGFWHGLRSWWHSLLHPERCSSLIYVFRKQ